MYDENDKNLCSEEDGSLSSAFIIYKKRDLG